MAASTGDRTNLPVVLSQYLTVPIAASTIIYNGCLVATDASGNLNLLADTSGLVLIGQSQQNVNNSAGAAAALSCRVQPKVVMKVVEMDCTSPDETFVGVLMYAVDDHTCGKTGSTSNHILIGKCIGVLKTGTAGRVWVDLLDRVA